MESGQKYIQELKSNELDRKMQRTISVLMKANLDTN